MPETSTDLLLRLGLASMSTGEKDEDELESRRAEAVSLCTETLAAQAIYDSIFSSFPAYHGKQVSRRARETDGLTGSSLVYGEIEFSSFFATMEKVDKFGGEKKVFYDLGSGAGKPVIAAALSSNFVKCVGLEYLQLLVDASREAALVYEEKKPDTIRTKIEFHCCDITDLAAYDWTKDASVVFANSTCFDETLMLKIAKVAALLPSGTIFVTLTRKLPSDQFELCDSKLYQMSWGGATVIIQRRI